MCIDLYCNHMLRIGTFLTCTWMVRSEWVASFLAPDCQNMWPSTIRYNNSRPCLMLLPHYLQDLITKSLLIITSNTEREELKHVYIKKIKVQKNSHKCSTPCLLYHRSRKSIIYFGRFLYKRLLNKNTPTLLLFL